MKIENKFRKKKQGWGVLACRMEFAVLDITAWDKAIVIKKA